MSRLLLLPVVVTLLMPMTSRCDDAVQKEKALFQGTWKLESLIINGVTVGDDQLKTGELEIKGNVGSVKVADARLKWEFTIDPLLKPKNIDLKSVMGDDKDTVYPGIYTLEGDRFTMCRPFSPGNGRPDDFGAGENSMRVLVVWKRVKK